MIESLSSSLLVAASSTGASPSPSASATAPDVARFQAALGSPDLSVAAGGIQTGASPSSTAAASSAALAGSEAPPANNGAGDTGSPAVRTLGDAILDGLRSSSNEIARNWQTATDVLKKPDPSIADMLRLQMMFAQSTVQYELLGKTISKTAQNIDHVLRTQ